MPMKNSEIAEFVTATIVNGLAEGTVPWQQGWVGSSMSPRSLSTRKYYQGFNAVSLGYIAAVNGYESNVWGTFKQISERGGKVRKGEKASYAIFFKMLEVDHDESDDTVRKIPMLRYYKVFNLDQTEGVKLPKALQPVKTKARKVAVLKGVEAVQAEYSDAPKLVHRKQGRAFYDMKKDQITLPTREQFKTGGEYAATLFHEYIHSTGHSSRLDRLVPAEFGCETYAQEELVAEIGAVMLAHRQNMKINWKNSEAYVGGWLKALKDEPMMLVKASNAAAKAVTHILGDVNEDIVEDEEEMVAA